MVRRRFRARFAAEGTRRTGETIVEDGYDWESDYVTFEQLEAGNRRKERYMKFAIESALLLSPSPRLTMFVAGIRQLSAGLSFPAADKTSIFPTSSTHVILLVAPGVQCLYHVICDRWFLTSRGRLCMVCLWKLLNYVIQLSTCAPFPFLSITILGTSKTDSPRPDVSHLNP